MIQIKQQFDPMRKEIKIMLLVLFLVIIFAIAIWEYDGSFSYFIATIIASLFFGTVIYFIILCIASTTKGCYEESIDKINVEPLIEDSDVYVKYDFSRNGNSSFKYAIDNDGYPKIEEISIDSDVNIIEGNYSPMLLVHSYKSTKNFKLILTSLIDVGTPDTWYEFYLPENGFATN